MEQLTLHALEFEKVKTYAAQFACSPLGAAQIAALSPLTDFDAIEAALAEVSEIKELRALRGALPLQGFHDARDLLAQARVEGAILEPLDLFRLYQTLKTGRAITKYFAEIEPPQYPRIREKVERISLAADLEQAIFRSIDEEGEILDSASPKLKQIRKDLRQAKEKIQAWLQHYLQRQDAHIQDQVITLRHNRYVVPVKASSRGSIQGIVHDQSSSGVTMFIEPVETVEMNNQIAAFELEERQEIQRILLELTDRVREHRPEIEETLAVLGELDFINAKARLSERWQCQSPRLLRDSRLKLRQARHPLLLMQHEDAPARVVPIDLALDEERRALLITGPNTGGKTVSLKTVGLLVLMAQAGLHIPVAQDSELGVFDQIFADIGDLQSIEQSLSTFSSHISHIVGILAQATARSLALFDELGAGTDPSEGASLGVAILEYLDRVNAMCLATTHHDALKSYAYTQPRTVNACVEFDVNTLSPTYHLLIGAPGKSNAFVIAERLGLPGHIIERAKDLMGEDLMRVDHLIRKLTDENEEVERKKAEIEAKYRGVLRLEKETDRLAASAEKRRQEILGSAYEQAKEVVNKAIQQSQEVLQTLPKATREQGRTQVKTLHKAATQAHQALRQHQQQQQRTEPEKPRGEIIVGGRVKLEGFEQSGTVLKLSKDGKTAEIQVGAMRVEMPVNQLIPLGKAKPPSAKISVAEMSNAATPEHAVPFELVLVGKTVEDALELVSKYLDQAVMSGFSSVALVHGMGTGKLKHAISEYLRKHPHVVSYAVDERNYGMTNVILARK